MLSRVVSAHRSRWVGGGATTTTITTAGIVRRLLVTHRVTHLVSQPGPTGAAALAGTFNAQEVANTLWASVTMGREPGAGVIRELEKRALVQRGGNAAGGWWWGGSVECVDCRGARGLTAGASRGDHLGRSAPGRKGGREGGREGGRREGGREGGRDGGREGGRGEGGREGAAKARNLAMQTMPSKARAPLHHPVPQMGPMSQPGNTVCSSSHPVSFGGLGQPSVATQPHNQTIMTLQDMVPCPYTQRERKRERELTDRERDSLLISILI
jgi:hypothetical protein